MPPNALDHPLRTTERPAFEEGTKAVRIVDLFAGCGGLTLGVAQAAQDRNLALDVRLALDFVDIATRVYAANFPKANVVCASVENYFDGDLSSPWTEAEEAAQQSVGDVDLLLGGPPCQGHSDLNNHTRREDPKNALYVRMARAAEVLRPAFVVIENVPTVQHDKGDAVGLTTRHLEHLGYVVAERTLSLQALGLAQRRKRHVVLASSVSEVDPAVVLSTIAECKAPSGRDLRWAIGDLASMQERSGYDVIPKASPTNLERMQYLLDHDLYDLPNEQRPECHRDAHSYKSMYGRLSWDKAAQTITSGFGSIGQGRYMHPSETRALTAHEAARIQGFPDYFTFGEVTKRGDLSVMIGNAVPPALTRAIAGGILPALQAST